MAQETMEKEVNTKTREAAAPRDGFSEAHGYLIEVMHLMRLIYAAADHIAETCAAERKDVLAALGHGGMRKERHLVDRLDFFDGGQLSLYRADAALIKGRSTISIR
jgi:hypothetical protein